MSGEGDVIATTYFGGINVARSASSFKIASPGTRDMQVHHATALAPSREQMKTWSQNLGHEQVLTTFTSYGKLPVHQQGELIRANKAAAGDGDALDDTMLMTALARRLGKTG